MGIGVSLVLIAIGAILRWGVTASVSGLNLHIIGVILMVIGVIALIISLVFWSMIGVWYPGRTVRHDQVVRHDDYDDRQDRAA